jgi:hypothetical protein
MTESELVKIALSRGGSVGKSLSESIDEKQIKKDVAFILGHKKTSHTLGRMNATEQSYFAVLQGSVRADDVILFEQIKLRLADKTWYTPDFCIVSSEGISFHEAKGWMRDDAAVKIKVAASQYPMFKFFIAKKIKGGWDVKAVSAR